MAINVRDFSALVVGGDWQPAIRAAINAAQASHTGLYFPAGEYPLREPGASNLTPAPASFLDWRAGTAGT